MTGRKPADPTELKGAWHDAVKAGTIAPDAPAAEVAPPLLVTDRHMGAPDSDGQSVPLGSGCESAGKWPCPVRCRWATRATGLGRPWTTARGGVERAGPSRDGAVAPLANHCHVDACGLQDTSLVLGGFEPVGFCDRYGRTVKQELAVPEAEAGDLSDRADRLRLPVS
ncbi:hypothetical protein Slala03_50000 [Streptomyces lavendulae subsp. lavendulae]|nr:hypothetical protein Slala03_50000 [Streptomyces lavendulae subsp. lavendulae]